MGTLKSVTSATGARYIYTYGLHEYWAQGTNGSFYKTTGGGLRIQEIQYRTSDDKMVKRRLYFYGSDNNDRFDRVAPPGPMMYLTQKYVYGVNSDRTQNVDQYLLLSSPVNETSVYNGSLVAYKNVMEVEYDSNYIARGKTEYYFKRFTHVGGKIVGPNYGTGYIPYYDESFAHSLLERKMIYAFNDTPNAIGFKLIREERTSYKKFEDTQKRNFQKVDLGRIRVGNFKPAPLYQSTAFCVPVRRYDPYATGPNKFYWDEGTPGSCE
ncbi:hypothetical protein CTE07_03560 [Chitinophaga terrae (ex Kim and Jung 2007)]|nr:hypothetical protein CTE07_03560 [Chitinophaga terrae (ex Kim and Jung 2007)]